MSTSLQTHFYFKDQDIHSINLDTFLACEKSLRNILLHIAKAIDVKIELEISVPQEGGYISDTLIKIRDKRYTQTEALVIIPTLFLIAQSILSDDPELKDRHKAVQYLELSRSINTGELTLEEALSIYKKLDVDAICVPKSMVVLKKQCSNFYQSLEQNGKVSKVSNSILVNKKPQDEDKHTVHKPEFKNYIKSDEKIERIDPNAEIEIIAPVIKKSNYKWRGIYDERYINFSLSDKDFKSDVYKSLYSFETGSRLYAELKIKSIADDDGNLKDVEYEVLQVYEYYQPSTQERIKTHAGRKRDAEEMFNTPQQEALQLTME